MTVCPANTREESDPSSKRGFYCEGLTHDDLHWHTFSNNMFLKCPVPLVFTQSCVTIINMSFTHENSINKSWPHAVSGQHCDTQVRHEWGQNVISVPELFQTLFLQRQQRVSVEWKLSCSDTLNKRSSGTNRARAWPDVSFPSRLNHKRSLEHACATWTTRLLVMTYRSYVL